jgi:2-haloacid dehalogenase
MSPKPHHPFIVFDVNETLLDIEVLSPFFAATFGDPLVMRQWFAELILYTQALTLSGTYLQFGEIAVAVLKMVAEIRHLALGAPDIHAFQQLMRSLPPHPDARPSLQRLSEAGFRLVTLTNSTAEAGRALLDQAGLSPFFERQFSVDAVKRYKPAPETYGMVGSELGVPPDQLRLVAAHTWDTLGAMAAGYRAALVTRTGNAALPIGLQPDIVEQDLLAVADRIIAVDGLFDKVST